jgi:hypothetical protein
MNIQPYWEQRSEKLWHRVTVPPNIFAGVEGPSAYVQLAVPGDEDFGWLANPPGYAWKWFWSCWVKQKCPAIVGPFESREAAVKACEEHFESGHTKNVWPNGTDIRPPNRKKGPRDQKKRKR